jgi:serine/threonine-protein phosphatase 2A regulatory subunit B'
MPKSGERDIPKSGALNRLKNAPKDQIPISKGPRRQKSSRFYVNEKQEIKETPPFNGMYTLFGFVSGVTVTFSHMPSV